MQVLAPARTAVAYFRVEEHLPAGKGHQAPQRQSLEEVEAKARAADEARMREREEAAAAGAAAGAAVASVQVVQPEEGMI